MKSVLAAAAMSLVISDFANAEEYPFKTVCYAVSGAEVNYVYPSNPE